MALLGWQGATVNMPVMGLWVLLLFSTVAYSRGVISALASTTALGQSSSFTQLAMNRARAANNINLFIFCGFRFRFG